jgi:putative ABC transport system permease protein
MFQLMLSIVLIALALVLALSPWLASANGRQSMWTAARSLLAHKLRSCLSVLGIIIGAAAVIALMAFGEGSMRDALEDIKRQGATNIMVVTVKPPDEAVSGQKTKIARYGLTYEDLLRFEETLKPTVIAALPLRVFNAELRPVTDARMYNGRVVATQARYADLHRLHDKVAVGRFLCEQDEKQISNVAVLRSQVASELFPGDDPLNKTIKIKDRAFKVVGVLKDHAPSSTSTAIEQFDDDVYIPLRSWRERVGELIYTRSSGAKVRELVQLSQIILTVSETEHVRPTAEIIRAQLQQFHDKADVDVRVPLDRLEAAERTRNRYRILLFLIAGISLVVGGIGIMNIMLATVTERTREIGIRRALGAKRKDITMQFLTEAVLQTTLGGVLGVASGLVLMQAIPMIYQVWQAQVLQLPPMQIEHLPVQAHIPSFFLAFLVAVGVGIFFGWYPARRAAWLDPIEALRHE